MGEYGEHEDLFGVHDGQVPELPLHDQLAGVVDGVVGVGVRELRVEHPREKGRRGGARDGNEGGQSVEGGARKRGEVDWRTRRGVWTVGARRDIASDREVLVRPLS